MTLQIHDKILLTGAAGALGQVLRERLKANCKVLRVSDLNDVGAAADREEVVQKRLEVYHSQTRPLVDYYSAWAATGDAGAPRYARISGSGNVDQITARAMAALG